MRRAKQRIDDGHVAHGVREWHRHFALAPHGLREQIALDGVLVADRECFGLDAGAEQVGAVVHEDAARTIRRRVEWDFDLDAAGGSEQLHALIGNQLCGAGEDGLAGGVIEDGGGEAVGMHLRVALQQGHDAARLLAEDEAGGVDGIAADIEQAAAAPGAHVADVGGVAVEIAEEAHDGAQFADAAGADQLARAQPLGMRAHHEGFADLDAGAGLRREQLAGFGGVERKRLLAEHVLSGLGRNAPTRARAGDWAAGCRPPRFRDRPAAPRRSRRLSGCRGRRPPGGPWPGRARRWRQFRRMRHAAWRG